MNSIQLPVGFSSDMRQAQSREISKPFRHWVIDGMHDPDLIERAEKSVPPLYRSGFPWVIYDNPLERKHTCNDWRHLPSAFLELLQPLYTSKACWEWSMLTGIKDLLPDPELWGGGLHLMPTGGFLHTHLDHSVNPAGLFRRLTMLVFLSPWEHDGGGELRLHGQDARDPLAVIQPLQGRTVLFENGPHAWHSVAKVTGGERKTLALYFLTAEDPHPGQPLRRTAMFAPYREATTIQSPAPA